MRTAVSKIGMVCLTAGLLVGCETMGEWADATGETMSGWADATGDAVTGLYDSTVGGGSDSFVGRNLGGINEKDGASLDRRAAGALDTAPAGRAVTWSNPETGVKATIVPGKTVTERRQIENARKRDVAAANSMVLVAKTYQAKKNVNLRAGPSTNSRIAGGLAAGERFTAIGKVAGGNWIMVGIKGKAIGYVFAKLVQPAKQGNSQLREVLDLDAQHPDGFGKDVVIDLVTVSTACRDVTYTVVNRDGEADRDTFRACKARDGAWEVN